MKYACHDELIEVVSNVLETIVFAFTEDLGELPSFDSVKYLTAEVSFSGGHSGTVTMFATETLCREWAEMMSTAPSATIHLDTLAELANIVAGNWVSRHFTDREPLKLHPPRVADTTLKQWSEIKTDLSLVTLSVDGHPLVLSVTVLS